jgi:hypothetical protein
VASETYDLEAIHDERIYPLMAQIIAICREHRIPLLCSFQYAASDAGEGGERKSSSMTFQTYGRDCNVLSRAADIVRNGLPEKRLMAFTVTKGQPRDE